MKENYIVASFRQTAAERFPEQAQELNAALDKRLAEMRRAHENDTTEKKEHLEGQILPGIPVWRTGAESKFPGMAYVIFPGNVGDTDSLRRAVEILTK